MSGWGQREEEEEGGPTAGFTEGEGHPLKEEVGEEGCTLGSGHESFGIFARDGESTMSAMDI